MIKKILLLTIFVFTPISMLLALGTMYQQNRSDTPLIKPVKELGDTFKQLVVSDHPSILDNNEIINILLLGIDRRNKLQTAYNTDTMILVSVNPEKNKVLLTTIPRDVWINDNKINALYAVGGWELLKDGFEQITGQEIQGYIRADFEDVIWIVDAFGGVPVNVERTFTDYSYPNNTDTGIITVSFNQGYEKLTGERALVFARSRKGTNGEGSDLMRAQRQHLILEGMIEAVSQPESIFQPMNIPKFFEMITQRMYTTLSIDDASYLWDFYKDRDKYTIESFVIDDEYIYYPGMYPNSPYHAWVFIFRDGAIEKLHQDIEIKLGIIEESSESTPAAHFQNDL